MRNDPTTARFLDTIHRLEATERERDELSAKFVEMQEYANAVEAERDEAVKRRDALRQALLVKLGDGQVGVCAASAGPGEPADTLVIEPKTQRGEIGATVPGREAGKTVGEDGPPWHEHTIMLTFTKVESVDVVIEELTAIREALAGLEEA